MVFGQILPLLSSSLLLVLRYVRIGRAASVKPLKNSPKFFEKVDSFIAEYVLLLTSEVI